jgi:hypothetical protein
MPTLDSDRQCRNSLRPHCSPRLWPLLWPQPPLLRFLLPLLQPWLHKQLSRCRLQRSRSSQLPSQLPPRWSRPSSHHQHCSPRRPWRSSGSPCGCHSQPCHSPCRPRCGPHRPCRGSSHPHRTPCRPRCGHGRPPRGSGHPCHGPGWIRLSHTRPRRGHSCQRQPGHLHCCCQTTPLLGSGPGSSKHPSTCP